MCIIFFVSDAVEIQFEKKVSSAVTPNSTQVDEYKYI